MPHTAHFCVTAGRSLSTDFFARARISGEMMGSEIGFFFTVFTINYFGQRETLAGLL